MQATREKIDVSANVWGKVKTVLEMFGIIIVFFVGAPFTIQQSAGQPCSAYYWYGIQEIILYFALIASIWSAVTYVVQMKQEITNREQRY